MSNPSRRDFLIGTASGALASAAGGGAFAQGAMGPNDKFDLVIKGGDVLDPSQSLRGKRDIGIRYGRIEALEADDPGRAGAARPRRRGQARHARARRPALARLPLRLGDRHPGGRARRTSVHHDLRLGRRRRREQLRRLPAPHRGADPHAPLRLRAHRQYRPDAVPGRRALQHRLRPGGCLRQGRRRERRHGDRRQGAHVRERRSPSTALEPLKRAIMACEKAGTGAKIMCHIGGVETRELMSQILDLLRPGDVLTHAYSGAPNLAGQFTNIVQDGRSCRRRSRRSSAASSSTSATAAAASTTPSARRRSSRAARPTRSRPTSTSSPATRRACPISPG